MSVTGVRVVEFGTYDVAASVYDCAKHDVTES